MDANAQMNKPKTAPEWKLYLDVMRVISIFFMMFAHVSASNWSTTPVASFQWQVFHIYDGLARFCLPVLVMVSGSLFLDKQRPCDIKRLYTHNIRRIVTAYLFWSAAYAIAFCIRDYLLDRNAASGEMIRQAISRFLLGHYHLWFVFTIICLYMIVPFLRSICADKRNAAYFLVLSFLFGIVVNALMLIPQFSDGVAAMMRKANMYMVLGYSGYFVLGHYLVEYGIPKKAEKISYVLGALSVLFTIVVTSVVSLKQNAPYGALYEILLPNTYFAAIAVFLLIKTKVSKLNIPEGATRWIRRISSLSFGMYLAHDFVNLLFNKIGLVTTRFNALISVPLISVCVFALSFLGIWMISKIPRLRRNII